MSLGDRKIWIGQGGEKYGPYTEASIRQWIGEGKLAKNAMAWHTGMPEWVSLFTMFADEATDEISKSRALNAAAEIDTAHVSPNPTADMQPSASLKRDEATDKIDMGRTPHHFGSLKAPEKRSGNTQNAVIHALRNLKFWIVLLSVCLGIFLLAENYVVFFSIIAILLSFGIYLDATHHAIGQDPVKRHFWQLSAGAWASWVFFLWPLGLPLYAIYRRSLIAKAKLQPVAPRNKKRSLIILGIASGLLLLWSLSMPQLESSYPTPEAFIARWNILPPSHEKDDDEFMRIDNPWSPCSGSTGDRCLVVSICRGNASIHALKDDATDSYTYVYKVVSEFSSDSSNPTSCMTGTQRIFNTLLDSPRYAHEMVTAFLDLNGKKIAESTTYQETINSVLYDVRVAHLDGAYMKDASPSPGHDVSASELLDFWSHSVDTIILSKTDPTSMRP